MTTTLHTHERPDGRTIAVVRGDITEEDVDAIVNAANERLAHGGGVAGAISRKGGPDIQRQSDAWVRERGLVPTGGAAITSGGRLKARHVIHAVGPVWGSGDEEALLASAVRSALSLADERGLASVSLPAISTGIFGFPKELGAKVILQAVTQFLDSHPDTSLRQVRLCNIDGETSELFASAARRL